MTTPTQPLRDEHRELLPMVELLRRAADSVGAVTNHELERAIDDVLVFLNHQLLPHARAEEQVLYPAVAKAIGGPNATATMSRDHVEVSRLTEELGMLRHDLGVNGSFDGLDKDLRRVLYGLYALVIVHFAKEEEVYLPILDERLQSDEAVELFAAMERAAAEAKHQAAA